MTRTPTTAPPVEARGFGRRFHHLWAASAASNLADGILLLAAPLLAVQLTRSPALVAGVTVAFSLPQVIAALPLGVLADRVPRGRIIMLANLLRMIAAAGMATIAGTTGLTILAIYVGVALLGTAEVAADTTTHAAIPQVVPRERLSGANSRMQATQKVLNDFVGAPLAGVLVTGGAVVALVGPAGLFALAALLALGIRAPKPAPREGATIRADVVEGLRFLWRHELIRALTIAAAVFNLAAAAFMSVFVLYAVDPGPMGLAESAVGLLFAANALGAMGGAVIAERVDRRVGLARVVRIGALVVAVAFALPVVTTSVWAVGVGFTATGAAAMCLNVGLASLRQMLIPDALLGRVTSGVRMIAHGSIPAGGLIGGLVGSAVGLRPVFTLSAALIVVAVWTLRRVTPEVVAQAHADGPHAVG